MDPLYELSQRLTDLMFDNQITIKDVATTLNIHITTVKSWLNSSSYIRLPNLIQLATLFNVSLDFILGRTEILIDYKPKPVTDVYSRLRQVIKEKNKTVYRMQKDIGIKDSYLSKWKSRQNIHILSLIKIADYLDVSIDYLIGRDC